MELNLKIELPNGDGHGVSFLRSINLELNYATL
jgi:hypothetical protein